MQRGTLKIESGSYRGFWNTYEIDPSTGEKKRRQRSVLLGPTSMGKKEAYNKLRKEIERSLETSDALPARLRPDGSITRDSTRVRAGCPRKNHNGGATPMPKGREINPGKTSTEDILKHTFKAFGSTPL